MMSCLQVKAAEAYCQEAAGGAPWRAAARFMQGMRSMQAGWLACLLSCQPCTCCTTPASYATGVGAHAGDFFKFKDDGGPFDVGYDYT